MKINNNKIKSLFLLSLVGSGSAKEENLNNQTGINLNSLPEIVTNFTHAKVTKRDNPGQNVLVAGASIAVVDNTVKDGIKTCTGGFVIVNTNTSDCSKGHDYGGLLTAFLACYPTNVGHTNDPYPYLKGVFNQDVSLLLGSFPFYWNAQGTDYLYVNANLANVKLTPFVLKTNHNGTVDLLPVISSSNLVSLGSPVCVYGAASGTRCGTITGIGLSLSVPNPWGWSPTLELYGLRKVDLGTNGLFSEPDIDAGAPVYTETQIGDRILAQALGHVTWIDNSDPQHQSFYYTPLEQTLNDINDRDFCTYSLLTYNENNAQKHDQLLAQVEIPAKK